MSVEEKSNNVNHKKIKLIMLFGLIVLGAGITIYGVDIDSLIAFLGALIVLVSLPISYGIILTDNKKKEST